MKNQPIYDAMHKDVTEVQFRRFGSGEIIGVFPYEIYNNDGNVMSYMHVGQHGECEWDINQFTEPANEAEYHDLYKELCGLGYNLKVIKRRSQAKYLKAYHSYVNELQAIL
jgi:hypothetical protein